jgi:hypothetical protein
MIRPISILTSQSALCHVKYRSLQILLDSDLYLNTFRPYFLLTCCRYFSIYSSVTHVLSWAVHIARIKKYSVEIGIYCDIYTRC